MLSRSWRSLTLALVATCLTTLSARAEGLSLVSRSILPLVALEESSQDYRLLGNTVVMDEHGSLVVPASVLRAVPASLLLPMPRIGVLVPAGNDDPDRPVSDTRVFQRVQVLHLEERSELALLELQGPLRQALPVDIGKSLALGAHVQIFGFGAPGVIRHLFPAAVTARIPVPSAGNGTLRYALDARATEACHGGLAFDPLGKAHALTLFHLKNVHRVVTKQADFEYGPAGTALGIPLDDVRSWVNQHRPLEPEEE